MSTPRDILLAAMGYSLKNKPETIDARAVELLGVVMRAMKGIYSFAAEVNPEYYGKSAAVAFTSGGWPRPSDAETVYYIENVAGQEVVTVPRSYLKTDPARPALYELGRKYFSAGNPLDPANGTLTFFYSSKAVTPGSIDTAFDALWDTDHDELLVAETAIYLALQDDRGDEIAAITPFRDKYAARFAAALEHYTTNRVYLFGSSRNYNIPKLIKTLLAGAGAAQ